MSSSQPSTSSTTSSSSPASSSPSPSTPPTIMVTGASGKLGSLIIQELLALQPTYPHKLIAASRSIEKLEHLKEKGVLLRRLDALDVDSVSNAFLNVDRVIMVSLDTPGKRFEGHKNMIDGAVKAGVKHILYTSCPVPVPSLPLYDEHFLSEAYLTLLPQDSTTTGHTILRNALYAETLLMSIPAAIAFQGGKWSLATGNLPRSYISRLDLALAAATAATTKYTQDSDRHLYELTSKEALNGEQVAKILSEGLSVQVSANFVSLETYVQVLSSFMPPAIAKVVSAIESHTKDGYDSVVTSHFRDLVGREAESLQSWVLRHKTLFLTPPTH